MANRRKKSPGADEEVRALHVVGMYGTIWYFVFVYVLGVVRV